MTYRYPPTSLVPDYLRAGLGIVATGVPLVVIDLALPALIIMLALASVFSAFAAQAVRRHRTRIEVTADAIAAYPPGTRVGWSEVTCLGLAYFSLRRDGEKGWMELKVGVGARVVRIDSRLEGFAEVVDRAAAAARDRALSLDATTASNLATMGLATVEHAPRAQGGR